MANKICIVEDEESIQDILKIILQRAGYEISIFSNGNAMIENRYELPDLFLLDKQLPGIDGISICRYLKKNTDTRQIPVIIMSAFPNAEELSLEAGADDFIEKPFQIEILLSKIKKHILTPLIKEMPA